MDKTRILYKFINIREKLKFDKTKNIFKTGDWSDNC